MMERDEMIRYIEFLQERLDEEKRARELSDKRFEEESAARKEADKRVFDLLGKIDRMGEQHSSEMQSLLQKNQELQQSIIDLTSAIRLNKKNRFASTSQKTRSVSKERTTRDEEREDHDGTPTNAPSEADVEVEETTEAAPVREDREIAALQSDAYNVYMFIDKELENVTHLCCMAHARAKFTEALEQGRDERARLFVDSIGQLYGYEDEYRRLGLSLDEIRRRRNDSRTADVMIRMSTELNRLLSNPQSHLGDMMQKALNYLHNYWRQLFAYRQNGRYTIDNNIAERNIRPNTVERKNSLFYGSGMMAEVSAVYHTFISTCSMLGVSAQKYFKMFFSAIIEGRRDYANLLPMTIGIK